ncbi:hypothetical protein F5883DRAFT_714285 [Diaporthe sp. PMI_573]|nr:hypothetical protein F5883DRAFT_714285 [Diaporthaceae sp. PMI_573]
MDTIDAENPQPTAQVPLLSGNRLALTTALLQEKSYYELGLMFQGLVDGARAIPEYLVGYNNDYITRLEEMSDPRSAIWRIFHTIPRKVLESLVLGTFAHDFLRASDRPDHYRDLSGFGVYAVAIAVAGRDGAWLKAKELTTLIENLEGYIAASISYHQRKGAAPSGRRERRAWDLVTKVDNMFGQHASGDGPRFVTSHEDHVVDGWRALVTSLKLRRDSSLAVDPSGNKPLLQGPLYAGCSTKLQNRSKAYDPQSGRKTKLDDVNRAYALMMSLVMYMGLQPVHVCRCVTRLWNRTELPVAEILVAALANSYISQDGFNRIVCGGESGRPRTKKTSGARSPKALKVPAAAQAVDDEEQGEEDGSLFDTPAEEYVKGRERYFYENIFASVEELRKRHAFVTEFSGLEPLFDAPGDNTVDHIHELRYELEEVQSLAEQARYYMKRCEKSEKAIDDSIAVLRQDLEIAGLVAKLKSLLDP